MNDYFFQHFIELKGQEYLRQAEIERLGPQKRNKRKRRFWRR